MVTEDMIATTISCGPDAEPHLERVRACIDAGCDHIYVHQVGPDRRGFLDFAARELLPALATGVAAGA